MMLRMQRLLTQGGVRGSHEPVVSDHHHAVEVLPVSSLDLSMQLPVISPNANHVIIPS